jgi:hypothetical protein
MSESHHPQPSHLERFCIIAEQKEQQENFFFSSEFENLLKHVWSEFTTTVSRDCVIIISQQSLASCYAEILHEAVCLISKKILSSTTTITTQKVQTSLSSLPSTQLLRILRTLAGLITISEPFLPKTKISSASLETRNRLLQKANQIESDEESKRSNDNSFIFCHLLQKQTAAASNAITQENFRLPGTVFDPRRAVNEVSEILSLPTSSSTSAFHVSGAPTSSYHLKNVLPFVSSLKTQMDDILSQLQLNNNNINEGKNNNSITAPSCFVRELAVTFQQLLGDVTNLLFRVSSQTPKNSPNCAFLTFLICDVSFHLAPYFCVAPFLSSSSSSSENERKSRTTLLYEILFSHKILLTTGGTSNHNSTSAKSLLRSINDASIPDLSKTAAAAKFEIALGCAIDCLNADLESSIAECCGKFENPQPPSAASQNHHQSISDQQNQQQQQQQPEAIASSGMLHLLVTVVHPLLTVLKCFTSSDSSQTQHQDVRRQIFATLLRLACSYWSRNKEEEELKKDGQELNSNNNNVNGRIEKDLKTLLRFCRNSIPEFVDLIRKYERMFVV